MLAQLANDDRVEVRARRIALRALANTPEAPSRLALATRLQSEGVLKSAARHVLKSFESRRSSSFEQILNLSAGDVLRDRGRPVKIDQILDLGSIDFGATRLEFWDPIQVSPQYLKVNVPTGPARVFAALSGTWARSLKLKFSSRKVVRWRRVGNTAGPYGTLVLSRADARAKIERMEFRTNFWDEVFDEVFEPSEGAAIVDLQLAAKSIPLLAWNDSQMGGTLYRGEDTQGRVAALLFDGVRRDREDEQN